MYVLFVDPKKNTFHNQNMLRYIQYILLILMVPHCAVNLLRNFF